MSRTSGGTSEVDTVNKVDRNYPGKIRFALRHDPVPAEERFNRRGKLHLRPGIVLETVEELNSHFHAATKVTVNPAGMAILRAVAPRVAARATVDPAID